MALGSSAPEILLSVIETVQTLEAKTPGELGPSTIVGSAAFNLMVISAVSVVSVNVTNAANIIESTGEHDENQPPAGIKKINDLGVFGITAVASVLAYIWLLVVLSISSPNYVELWEALLTLAFFFILVGLAFWADVVNGRKQAKREHNVPQYSFNTIMKTLHMTDAEINKQPEKEREENKKRKAAINKFLVQEYGHEVPFDQIDKEDLKFRLDLDPLLPRIKARKKVGAVMSGKKEVLKNQKFLK